MVPLSPVEAAPGGKPADPRRASTLPGVAAIGSGLDLSMSIGGATGSAQQVTVVAPATAVTAAVGTSAGVGVAARGVQPVAAVTGAVQAPPQPGGPSPAVLVPHQPGATPVAAGNAPGAAAMMAPAAAAGVAMPPALQHVPSAKVAALTAAAQQAASSAPALAKSALRPASLLRSAARRRNGAPPGLLTTAAAATGDERRRECFIPLRPCDLLEDLIATHPFCAGEGAASKAGNLRALLAVLSLRLRLRLERDFGDLRDEYGPFNPDVDTEMEVDEARGGVEGDGRFVHFRERLFELLDKSGFHRLGDVELAAAADAKSRSGFDTTPPKEGTYRAFFFARGRYEWEGVHRTIVDRLLCRDGRLVQERYSRLYTLFRLTNREGVEAVQKAQRGGSTDPGPLPKVSTNYWYLKMFKDIDSRDVDMLVPGSRVVISRLDLAMIIVPIVVSIISAIVKIQTTGLSFRSAGEIIASLALIIMPLLYAYKAYEGVKKKQALQRDALTNLLMLKMLDANGGTLSHLLDEAHEQELLEAFLAYFFLWAGQGGKPKPMYQRDLDRKVEKYLAEELAEASAGNGPDFANEVDFQVGDAVCKLWHMGLVETAADGSDRCIIQAQPLASVLELLSDGDLSGGVEGAAAAAAAAAATRKLAPRTL